MNWPSDFDSEERLVQAIRLHLLTQAQAARLHALGISIEDLLNGRTAIDPSEFFNVWNAIIGREVFQVY